MEPRGQLGMGWLQLWQLNENQMGGTENLSVLPIPITSQNLCLRYISFVIRGGKELLSGQSSPYHKINIY